MKKERVMKLYGSWYFQPKNPLAKAVGPFQSRSAARQYAMANEPTGIKPKSKVMKPIALVAPVLPGAYISPPTAQVTSQLQGTPPKSFVFGSLSNPTVITPAPKLKNRALLLLDSSGSMEHLKAPAMQAFNKVLAAIKEGTAANNQETKVSFYTFGGGDFMGVQRRYTDVDSTMVGQLLPNEYYPSGGTPMLNAIGEAVTAALATDDGQTSFILNVITDGYENTSLKYTVKAIQDLLTRVQATDRWTVTFMVPNGNKYELCRRFGISEGNVQEWNQTAEGTRLAGDQISKGFEGYFVTRSTGETFTKGFFVTDLSKLDAADAARQFTNIASKVRTMKVPSELDIQTFVESQGLTYARGKGFYQLTKDEKVQSYKEILLKEKNKPVIYGGKEARALLGLPAGENVKVRPGNHGNWDIFVQSTSNNRILVRGTTFLYEA